MSEFEQATRGIFPDRPEYAQRIWNAAIAAAMKKCEAVREIERQAGRSGDAAFRCQLQIQGLRESSGGCF